MLELLKNKIALVTGGNAGIGKAIALKFAEQGAKVLIFGNHMERGAQVVEEIHQLTKKHDNAFFYSVNVANKNAVDAEVKNILETFGPVDILVNNAGITRDNLLMKMSEEDWDKVMEVNVKSCYNTAHALVRSMIKNRKGAIINMSSVIGLIGNSGQVNYAASKAAIIGFTKALAKEVAGRQVRVNCICPGFIATAMTEVMTEEQKKGILDKIPLGHMGMPSDVANAALFLASELSAYVTGQVLTIDGGMVIS